MSPSLKKLPCLLVTFCFTSLGSLAYAAPINVVKIGFAAPLTGPSAPNGEDVMHGVMLAIEEANAQKIKLDGKVTEFKLIAEDDAADPKTATTVAQRLIDAKVSVVIGHYNSGTSIPASRLYAGAGIPQISPSATNPTLTNQGFKSVFRVLNSDATLGRYAGSFIVKDLKAKKIAVIDDRTAYGQGLADAVAQFIGKSKGNIAVREFTNDKATDFSALLTRCKAAKVDLIFFAGLDYQAAPMAKQIRNLGLKAAFLNIGDLPNENFVKLSGHAAEGVYALNYGLPLSYMPKGATFDKKLKAKFGHGVLQFSPFAYDATWTAITAMKQANSSNPKQYLPALHAIQFEGITGKISFDAKGDLNHAAASVFQFKHGVWNTLAIKRSE
ncbi:branched-chain amino acid ABC transporter substrate-binding protein [Leeia sp. TBRC 13508]|uniref:Branched-chain amino acid ABC transporter substrate-binding protein n=1 Tax=Leeia speluncae TaxID=2884804 RepID=A0ABS8D8J7_9NEIS|nr:branched-chain amino acid ABC transporter substrate-binding protein [Leeia speluncae]MCB6184546.1 branched-chain amino acid ABC transporter substrate-binding protein [Leeia speluncae]